MKEAVYDEARGDQFHRQGAAYRKERLVIFKEDPVGGRTRVTMMKNVCCDKVEQKSSCRDIEVGELGGL